jgi:hypothetical protein
MSVINLKTNTINVDLIKPQREEIYSTIYLNSNGEYGEFY